MSNWDEIDITTPDPEETEPNENEETELNENEETENPSSLGSGLLGGPLGGGLTLGLGASPALTSTGNSSGDENESGRLTWDGTGKRFYENGVDHGILFVSNGDGTYRNGIVWNGLTTVTESPDGAEPNDLWADNMKYATLYSNETFGATIEAYTYPDEFSECDGSYEPMPGVYYGQQDRKPFAFCYRTHVGNDTGLNVYKLHIVYNCKASPSEKSYETINDSPDAITFSWEVSTIPVPHGNIKPISTITIDESKLDDRAYAIYLELLNKIYGDGANPPTLPSTDEIANMFGAYEGNPVEFKATKSSQLSKVLVKLEPVQEGSGDPSPDNVRAISGHSSVSAVRMGKNLIDNSASAWEENGINSSGANATASEQKRTAGYYGIPRSTSICISGITSPSTNSDVRVFFYDSSKTFIEYRNYSSSWTTPANAAYLRLRVPAVLDISGLQIEVGTTPTTYEPYQSNTYTVIIPSTPGTVYGGTLDVNTGELEVTYGYIESYSGQTLTGKWVSDRDVYSEDTSPTTGAEVVYELAEPITYDLSSQQMSILSVPGTNIVRADDGCTLEIVYREDVGAAASSGYTKQQLLNLSDPLYVKNLVRIGTAEQVFDIGDQFNVTWNDGENTYDCPFDVVHFGKVINKHGQEVNAMYLQSHYAIPATQFDASEAIYYADEAMAAGTYYFTIGDNWSTGFVKNDVIAFTTTQQIPAGGQVVIGSSTSAYTWGGEGSTYSSWKVYTYASKESLTPIESVAVSQGTPIGDATNLGTITVSQKYSDTGLNNLQRASRGYNRWSQSGVRQWINSDAAAGSWWTAQNNYDRPPEQLSTMRGFTAGLQSNFLDMVSPMGVSTYLNQNSDSEIGTRDSTMDLFALASLEQEYCVPQTGAEGIEGKAFKYWIDKLDTDTPQGTGSSGVNTEHVRQMITDHSTNANVRLRSVSKTVSHIGWIVASNGIVNSQGSSYAYAVCPYCVVY